MEMHKFVNIEIDGQENIGVLDLGIIKLGVSEEEKTKAIEKVINQKLPMAIQAHYDEDVEITELTMISVTGYILYKGKVRILDFHEKEDCSTGEFTLVETWIY